MNNVADDEKVFFVWKKKEYNGKYTLFDNLRITTADYSITSYTVKHYLEQPDGTYKVVDADTISESGKVGTPITADIRSYTGYVYDPVVSTQTGTLVEKKELALDLKYLIDTDGDGIANKTDPDDDNDGVSDEKEKEAGTDPLDPASKPIDTDGDGKFNYEDDDDDNDSTPDTAELTGQSLIAGKTEIQTQPTDQTVLLGSGATFDVTVTGMKTEVWSGGNPDWSQGTGDELSYQRQVLSGDQRLSIPQATGSTFAIPKTTDAMNGKKLRVAVHSHAQNVPVFSDPVTLHILYEGSATATGSQAFFSTTCPV